MTETLDGLANEQGSKLPRSSIITVDPLHTTTIAANGANCAVLAKCRRMQSGCQIGCVFVSARKQRPSGIATRLFQTDFGLAGFVNPGPAAFRTTSAAYVGSVSVYGSGV